MSNLNEHIDKSSLIEALMAAVELTSSPETIQAGFGKLLADRKTVVNEYNDNHTRQLIQKVVVRGEDRFEIIYE